MGRKLTLSHVGLSCVDLNRLEDFYTRVRGMTVTDRGTVPGGTDQLIFLTTDPSEHHQLVLASGRTEGTILEGPVLGGAWGAAIFQLTFRLADLPTLRRVQQRLIAEGNTNFIPLNHGNAWSVYTRDPEGNALEFVVGAGPVGMTAALLLSRLSIPSRIIERRAAPQSAPAAHVINARTFEIFRAAGVDIQAIAAACQDPADAGQVLWVTALAGRELGRLPYER